MNKKGQNTVAGLPATDIERCHCPGLPALAGWLARLAAREGDCGLESHQLAVGTTDTPVQPNLLLEYRNRPRLSDGANNTILKNVLMLKKEKNKKRRLGNAHYIYTSAFLIIADIMVASLYLFIYRSYLLM